MAKDTTTNIRQLTLEIAVAIDYIPEASSGMLGSFDKEAGRASTPASILAPEEQRFF